jgi:hypothetical protein
MEKGRKIFSASEASSIRKLLAERGKADRDRQKGIRNKLRRLGFYITDFDQSNKGFDPGDFDNLIASGIIQIKSGENISAPSTLPPKKTSVPKKSAPRKSQSDESYIIDLCDEVLGKKGDRQKRFPFLVGDSGSKLPVDSYYPQFNLVVEYRERQHSEPVKFLDKRKTVSGVDRGTQRKIYDQRRRDVLPQHGINLVELSYDMFDHDSRKRLFRRREKDLEVVRVTLRRWAV